MKYEIENDKGDTIMIKRKDFETLKEFFEEGTDREDEYELPIGVAK